MEQRTHRHERPPHSDHLEWRADHRLRDRSPDDGLHRPAKPRRKIRRQVSQYSHHRIVIMTPPESRVPPAREGRNQETPSPPSDGGEGRGEEEPWMPLSSVLSPLLRRKERKRKRAP